jgi:hypothetical protein
MPRSGVGDQVRYYPGQADPPLDAVVTRVGEDGTTNDLKVKLGDGSFVHKFGISYGTRPSGPFWLHHFDDAPAPGGVA